MIEKGLREFDASGDGVARTHSGARQKLSLSDPSLRVPRPVGRRLRKGPVALTLGGLVVFAALLVGLATSVRGSSGVDASEVEIEEDPPAVPVVSEAPVALPSVPEKAAGEDNGPYSAAALRKKRVAEYWKARGSAILVQSGSDPLVAAEFEESAADDDEAATSLTAPSRPARPNRDAVEDPNLQEHKSEFMAANGSSSNSLRTIVRRPKSPYELKPGTIVPAVLETAINSDLPGPVIARVTQNICDTVHGDWLLIPQGSTLMAFYDSMVAWRQERVLVCWKQLELPDGGSVDLGCMPGADSTGRPDFTTRSSSIGGESSRALPWRLFWLLPPPLLPATCKASTRRFRRCGRAGLRARSGAWGSRSRAETSRSSRR